MNGEAAYTLDTLRAVDPAARADVLRVLDRVVRDLPGRWSRGRGVPRLMVSLDGHGGARTERTELRELSRHGYLDELQRWVDAVPWDRAREHGCAALVYGDRIHARINRIGPYGAPRFVPDTHAHVRLAHRDVRGTLGFAFPFRTEGRLFPRLVFHDWVAGTLERARPR
ncbi:hypothetical protein ACIRIU_23115 [Streptomyces sp. NPDC102351]|uniref:hypothetical protein n=1 Tax=Streptomyces sp. NPDC102351 TaxID=3366158 RepID=UPI00382B9B03